MNKRKYILSLLLIVFIISLGVTNIYAANDTDDAVSDSDVKKVDNTPINKEQTINKKIKNTNNITAAKEATQTAGSTNTKTVSNYKQLVSALSEAKDAEGSSYTINMKKGTYTITESVKWGNFNPKTGYVKTLTINGNGAVIDGKSSKTFISVLPKYTLNLNDLTIKNTKTPKSATGVDDAASAINTWEESVLNINKCTFINNVGGEKGGAITVRNKLNVKNSTFTSNLGYWGGAIYVRGQRSTTKATITGCTFNKHTVANSLNNYNNEKMGFVYFLSCSATLTNNKFIENNGRCIHIFQSTVTVDNNIFQNNKILETKGGKLVNTRVIRGGLIDSYESTVTITNNNFASSNIATAGTSSGVNGGVLYHEIGPIRISGNTFANVAQGNSEKENGGSIYIRNANAMISDNTFTNTFSGIHVRGGSVYGNIATLTLDENVFKNTVKSKNSMGGSVATDNNKLTLIDNVFDAKVSGGSNKFNTYYTFNTGNPKILHKTATKTQIGAVTSYVNQTVALKATVTTTANKKITDGSVQFYVNGTLVGTKALKNGAATLNYKIPLKYSGKVSIMAKFVPKSLYKKSNGTNIMTLLKKAVTVKINSSTATYTQNKFIYTTVKAYTSGKVLKYGSAIIKVNGKALTDAKGNVMTISLSKGSATRSYKIPTKTAAKTYTITAEYTGNTLYNTAKSSALKVKL